MHDPSTHDAPRTGGGTVRFGTSARAIPSARFGRQAAPVTPVGFVPQTPHKLTLADIYAGVRQGTIDLTPSLRENIFSAAWWRGVVTLTALCATVLGTMPGLQPIPAYAASMRGSDADLARALAIGAIKTGSNSGRRTAPTQSVQLIGNAPERPIIERTATLGDDETLGHLLLRSGVSAADSEAVLGLVAGEIGGAKLRPGTRFDLTLGRRADQTSARPLEHMSFRAGMDLRLKLIRSGNELRAMREAIAINDTPLRIRGRVGDSMYRSARAAGADPATIQSWLRVMAGQLSISGDISPDDEYDIIVGQRRAATGEVQIGDLLYAGLNSGGRPRLRMVRWQSGGTTQWYEASGVGEQKAGLSWPVDARMSSTFGLRRHPILGILRMHKGIDFAAGSGTPIHAVTDGIVQYAGWSGGYGRFVKLMHGDGLSSGYGHMSALAVSGGQRVSKGQIIGYVGSSGLSTGPHLHYELYRNGVPVNPASVRYVTRSLLSGNELTAFQAQVARLSAIQ